MMNKTLHIIYILLALFTTAHAQDAGTPQPKVQIFGNVYGGGDLAQVESPDEDLSKVLVKDDMLNDGPTGLFNAHANHQYTTYVHLGENAEVYGQSFGGGKGHNGVGTVYGRVIGQTDLVLDGATAWSELYGGGQMADVRGNTLLHFKKGRAGHNAFGGGLGVLTTNEENGNILPDNRQTVLASADVRYIGTVTAGVMDDAMRTDIPATGNTFVVFDGNEDSYTHYEFKEERKINYDAQGKVEKRYGKYYTSSQQFNPETPNQLFSINHNIYGGGMTASNVDGNTYVHIRYGMVNEEMMTWEGKNRDAKSVWSQVFKSIANAQFCVFGGGYGYHSEIKHDTHVSMNIAGSGTFKYINEFTEWFAGEGKEKYHWDTNTGTPEDIYKAADEATHSHGAPGRSCMDIVGGGYNGRVHGTTHVETSGDLVVRKVYGGGYYASVANTEVTLKSGIYERVYGGGLIGNVYGKATLNFGQQGLTDEVYNNNLHLLVKDAVYGGNDVSGTVGTSVAHPVTAPNGVTYNTYTPVDDADDKGVRLNIYGGLVLGDVYGAGNGNHPGYGNPEYMEFMHSQHPSENYRTLPNAVTVNGESKNHVYKYRPRTARVEMNIAGNAGDNFDDIPTVDKVRIWGRTFGGGNSCNVGIWDGTADDNAEVYADDNTSWHPGDNFQGGGTIQINIGSHVQLGNRNDSHETPNGLFMGCNGEHMITQHTDKDLAKYYHQYWDSKAQKYYPGFVVYEDDAVTPIKRTTGLKAFKAFINNILTWTNNVNLNIDENAEDIWMSNFVGGGYRGSMKAFAADPQNPTDEELAASFDYTLPEGVTVGHSVVGGAFNAHIIYRVYATEYGTGIYTTDTYGNYQYETVEPSQGVISKAQAEAEGKTDYDYIKKLYAEGHEGDENYKTGYLRYNFDGGMLAHDSEMNAQTTGSRIHQVHADPRTDESEYATSYFEPLKDIPAKGDQAAVVVNDKESDDVKKKLYTANKNKALVQLHLNCALHPTAHDEKDPDTNEIIQDVHGGIVYGGCFSSGYIDGDTWVDYGCWLSPLCVKKDKDGKVSHFFDKSNNMSIYGDVSDLEHIRALAVYGAGYGEDTHSMGDVYVYIKSIATDGIGDDDKTGKYPYIFNVFGGGNLGTVAGNTNVYYAVGKQGTLLGSLYGGGFKGYIGGNTFVELAEGFVTNVYGGSRQANIGGAAHVWAYDGKYRGIPDSNHIIICNLYGGNDIAGTISGTMPAAFTADKWNEAAGIGTSCESLTGKQFNTYVEISSDNRSANRGFPLIGSVFASGNGDQWKEGQGLGDRPDVAKALLEIDGGSTLRAFGGGNKATVTESTHIFTDALSTNFADVTFAKYQTNIMKKVFFNGQQSGYRWDDTHLIMHDTHVFRLFGGNNLATMDIQPTWNLKNGHLENVYSGGNRGDMTYYNPDGKMARTEIDPATHDGVSSILGVENRDGTNVNLTPKGLSITVNSPDIRIGSLFGGCRMSDVKANDTKPANYDEAVKGPWQTWPDYEHGGEDCYGATVNVIDGNIGYIFGGNDVSGKVEHGTNINICGGVIGQVYGSGNGDFLYKFIPNDANTNASYGDIYDDGKNDTNITEHMSDEFGIYYTVPENDKEGKPVDDSSTGDTHKIMTINKIRPSVDNTFINIQGMPAQDAVGTDGDPGYKPAKEKFITLIKGNVYVGGNATTITRGNEDAFSKFKYGSYAVANGLFFGSDGQDYTKDEVISSFAKLNGISDMGASTTFNTGHEDDARHNPILLNAYMTAVDMEALPKEFAIPTSGLKEIYVGTICGGGNRGSMLTNKRIDLVIPHQITVFDKIVAGCNDATINYNQNGTFIKSIGGYTRPIEDHATYGNTKISYNIAAQFVPLTLDVPMGADLRVPVNRTDLNNHNETWADAIKHAFLWPRVNDIANPDHYLTGCNIYGGCYSSGEIEGDVELNIYSNMLRYANETKFQKAIANGETCFNVFGAGFGQDSHVWGNVHIKMDKSDNLRLVQPVTSPIASVLLTNPSYLDGENALTTYDTPSVNNIFGGGRNGQLIGNTTIEVRNGRVYSDVVGGCYASHLYGSSQIIVGYPTYYRCKTSGEYALQRGDKWNPGQKVIKRSVKYLKGDLVPKNVYDQITDGSKSTKFDPVNDAPADWSTVDIKIGEGVYGGGYSLANSTSASAGTVTTHKLQAAPAALETLHPLNFDGRYGLEAELSTVGYGGNSAIMVGDEAGDGSDDSDDHIQISKLNDGGIYGDGHLTFCEGFRAADITGYGYNTSTPKTPLLLNTFQRLDLLDVNDCCLLLEGAQDFATNQIDATVYSATRIDELRMNSSLAADGNLTPLSNTDGTAADGFTTSKVRNYIGFNNNVHYLGAIVTNDKFDSDAHTFRGVDGTMGTRSYKAEKAQYISTYSSSAKDAAATEEFKKRNVGTARNCIGLNSGYCLRVQNLGNSDKLYYGPIVGVCEVKLLSLQPGEGGGYVYADNVHADIYDTEHPSTPTFMNESGNFVFPGIDLAGSSNDQYIVDDCFFDKFGTPADLTTKHGDLDEAHYWYVEGNKYFYHTTLTGYTFQDRLTFNLTENDPNVILSGMEKGSRLNIKKIDWQSTHRGGYKCVLENDDNPEKTDDYQFDIEIGGASYWTNHMPRHDAGADAAHYTTTKTIESREGTYLPQFNIKLEDWLNNSGDSMYINHLDEPELVKIYLEGTTGGQTYEYTITLNIVYLQGPTYEGGVTIENCALPGEHIGFSTSGITIKTPDLMPITSTSWQILPLKEIDSKGVWKWDNENGTIISTTQYTEDLTGNLSGWIPALYKQNESNIAFTFTAGGHSFPVMPKQDVALKQNRMIVVHNYHRMKDVVTQNLQIEEMPSVEGHPDFAEAKLYIEDEEDLRAFVNYLNMAYQSNTKNIPEGLANIDIILQNDITLTQSLPAISVPFAGNFHGDGYHIDLDGKQNSFFGSNLTGQVYNLGLWHGTISTVDTRAANGIVNGDHTDNCYETVAHDNFTYGRNAYDLSHHFVEHGPDADYVVRYYANGDYQYATTDRVWSLRTGEPWYGHTETRHDVSHEHDADRWLDAVDNSGNEDVLCHTGHNVPLHDATKTIANIAIKDPVTDDIIGHKYGIPAGYANDYLYFGQKLNMTDADAYPVHINADESNRVFQTGGYYRSTTDEKFQYNREAQAYCPMLTAIDFTHMSEEGDGAVPLPASFVVDSNRDADGDSRTDGVQYSNTTTGHITQNLLIYNSGEDVFDKKDVAHIHESEVTYHNIVASDSPATYSTENFHLVDKQDFCAPIRFNVTERAWYERKPQGYRNVPSEGYENGSAWEGICLPFTVQKVIASTNGEISHFYHDSEINHEYWLRGLTGVTTSAGETNATFAQPATSTTVGFVDAKQTNAKYNYVYKNTYFAKQGIDNHEYDITEKFGEHYSDAASDDGVTYNNYIPLTSGVPYIVAFPGNDFYEFSMEGDGYYDFTAHGKSGSGQMATFESSENVVIPVTAEIKTTVDGYNHIGTFLHVSDVSTVNDGGSAFDTTNGDVLPFRTYMSTVGGGAAPRRILIAHDGMDEEQIDMTRPELTVSVSGRTVTVNSTYDRTLTVTVYTAAGQTVVSHEATPGTTVFRLPAQGVYIIQGRKFVAK